jgi:hypothetical protein
MILVTSPCTRPGGCCLESTLRLAGAAAAASVRVYRDGVRRPFGSGLGAVITSRTPTLAPGPPGVPVPAQAKSQWRHQCGRIIESGDGTAGARAGRPAGGLPPVTRRRTNGAQAASEPRVTSKG